MCGEYVALLTKDKRMVKFRPDMLMSLVCSEARCRLEGRDPEDGVL